MDLYAKVIVDFAAPLLQQPGEGDAKTSLKIAQIAWNYAIAEKYEMPAIEKIHDSITDITDKDPHMQETFRMLAKRKDIEFDAYNNYIIEISGEIDTVADKGSVTADQLRVTHFNPGKYIGLGTLKKPAFLTVQDEDLAIQILTAAADRKWLVLIEDKDSVPPDTFELDLLQSGLIPGPEFEDEPKKNEPCTCGSGKPYKKCCGKI